MLTHLSIEVDGQRVTSDKPMSHAEAREWLIDQAVRLTRREAIAMGSFDTLAEAAEARRAYELANGFTERHILG